MSQTTQQILQQVYSLNIKVDRLQRTICCSAGSDLTQVYTQDSATVSFSGSGTQDDPLTATATSAAVNTFYNSDYNGSLSRNVNMTYGSSLNFNSADQGGNATAYQIHLNSGGGGGQVWMKSPAGQVILTSGQFRLNSSANASWLDITPTSFDFTWSPNITSASVKADGVYLPLTVSASTLGTDGTGKIVPVTLTKASVGLSNVDNTSDTAKPVSTAQQTALNLKANLASPALTGTPVAPTAAVTTNTTQIATTAFVKSALPTKGIATVTADGVITAFAIPHGLGVKPASVALLPANAAASTLSYFVDEAANDATNITLSFVTPPPSGTLMFYWQAFRT